MNKNVKEPSLTIETTLKDLKSNFEISFGKGQVILPSKTLEKLKLGDPIIWSRLFYMMSLDCLKSERETNEVRLSEQLIAKPSNDSNLTLSLTQLLVISSLLETSAKRYQSLRQKLTPTAESGRAITLLALQQADSLLALTILDLEEISRILKKDFGEYLSPILV